MWTDFPGLGGGTLSQRLKKETRAMPVKGAVLVKAAAPMDPPGGQDTLRRLSVELSVVPPALLSQPRAFSRQQVRASQHADQAVHDMLPGLPVGHRYVLCQPWLQCCRQCLWTVPQTLAGVLQARLQPHMQTGHSGMPVPCCKPLPVPRLQPQHLCPVSICIMYRGARCIRSRASSCQGWVPGSRCIGRNSLLAELTGAPSWTRPCISPVTTAISSRGYFVAASQTTLCHYPESILCAVIHCCMVPRGPLPALLLCIGVVSNMMCVVQCSKACVAALTEFQWPVIMPCLVLCPFSPMHCKVLPSSTPAQPQPTLWCHST